MNNVTKLIGKGAVTCILALMGVILLDSSAVAREHAASLLKQANVIGTVRSVDGNLAGVSISSVNSPTVVTSTNESGEYSILVNGSDTLVYSFVGYESLRIPVNNRRQIDVELTSLDHHLDEVVVVGYGTQRKETLTGAISTVRSKDIQTSTNSSLAQKLQGKVPGLQIRQNSQMPGEFSASVNVRGFGTPLFVIDGIARDGSNVFQRLNPADIESITVLKDASAAIYGVRAANGVIIVTTKKGQKGEPRINYTFTSGLQTPTSIVEMADAATYMTLMNDATMLATGTPHLSPEELEKYRTGAPGYESTDWTAMALKGSTPQFQHDLSYSGGTEKTQFYVNLGIFNEHGLLKSNDIDYNRYTLRSNVTTTVAKNLTAEVMLFGKYDKANAPGENFFNIFRGTRQTLPTESAYANNNPDYLGLVTSGFNPLATMNREMSGYNEDVYRDFQTTMSLQYKFPFAEGLSAKGVFGYDARNYQNKNLFKSYPLYTYNGQSDEYQRTIMREGNSFLANSNSNFDRVTWQAHLNYKRTFGDNHNLNGVFVFESQKWFQRGSSIRRYYGDLYTIDQLNFTQVEDQVTSGMEDETANLSYIGRVNYDYASKYLLEVAFRQDGSYRYHPDQRWGFFPVASVGWVISEEPFFRNRLPFVNQLKFRGSYGVVGEDAGNPFQYIEAFSLTGGGGYEFADGRYTHGASAPGIVNPHLTWFTSNILDIGLDLNMWDGKFGLIFDVYQRNRSGLLAVRNASLPNTFGGTLPQENLNSDQVRGFDFQVSHRNTIGEVSYGASFNFNFARTMNRHIERGEFTNSMDRWRNGRADRWNDIVWGYVKSGQFQNLEEIRNAPIQSGTLGNVRELPGDFRYEDVNGDGIINGQDVLPLFYNGVPKMHAGLMLNASYKGFDANVLFQGSSRYTLRFEGTYVQPFAYGGNLPAYFQDRWRLNDPYDLESGWISGKWPAIRENSSMGSLAFAESSARRLDASYIRLKSVEIGYTIPKHITDKIFVQGLRVFANGHNLFTITDPFVRPFDPEKAEGNANLGLTYPLIRSFNFGVNLSF